VSDVSDRVLHHSYDPQREGVALNKPKLTGSAVKAPGEEARSGSLSWPIKQVFNKKLRRIDKNRMIIFENNKEKWGRTTIH
jgi:hypothetical protein